MRGEHNPVADALMGTGGSSPHARGAHERRARLRRHRGIIPACAGSTRWRTARSPPRRDHPRMRGEHVQSMRDCVALTGSSPHARGALRLCDGLGARRGIIPACAGSTRPRSPSRRCRRDHPRMRGEHPFPRSQPPCPPGSSPHARGALLDALGGI